MARDWGARAVMTVLICVLPCAARAAVLKVGAGEPFAKPSLAAAAAHDGDIVEIAAGTYSRDVAVWKANRLTLRGIGGRAVLDSRGATAQGKAIWVIQGNDTAVEDIAFTGASAPDRTGAGIRQEGQNLILRHCFFHDNDEGLLAGDSPNSVITVEDCEFDHNGQGDGFSHNLYINHVRRFTLRGCWVHDAHVGHDVKSRAPENDILYNRISDDNKSDTSYLIDFPEGGRCRVIGNILHRGSHALQSALVSFAGEGANNPQQALYIINNTIVNDRDSSPPLRIFGNPRLYACNNLVFMRGASPSDIAHLTTTAIAGRFKDNRFASAKDFADAANNYHLAAGAPAINGGADPGSVSGFDLMPCFEYVAPVGVMVRVITGLPDLGAFEQAAPH